MSRKDPRDPCRNVLPRPRPDWRDDQAEGFATEPAEFEEAEDAFPRKVHVVCRTNRPPLVFASRKKARQVHEALRRQGAATPDFPVECHVAAYYDDDDAGDRPGRLFVLLRWIFYGGGYREHPYPAGVSRDPDWAADWCAVANREAFLDVRLDPFLAPPLPPGLARSQEERERLVVLCDYVQDLGLAAPVLGADPYPAWGAWWAAVKAEPWQREAVWRFLGRVPPYSIVPAGLRT